MPLINLNDLKEGMVTAKPVSIQNRIIIGEGVKLTEKSIHLFKAWGVVTVEVVADNLTTDKDEESTALNAQQLKEIYDTIDNRFRLVDENDEIMAEVKRIASKIETKEFLKAK